MVLLARGLKVIAIEEGSRTRRRAGTRENLTVVTVTHSRSTGMRPKVIGNIPLLHHLTVDR